MFKFKFNVNYNIKENKIHIIDSENTGIIKKNTVWQKGLHQFMEAKHKLPITPMSTHAVFISNVSFFKQFNICGLTGTLGGESSQKFFRSAYGVKSLKFPPFIPKNFIEYNSILCKDKENWFKNIKKGIKEGRSYLLICESIQDVKDLTKELEKLQGFKIKAYSDNLIEEELKLTESTLMANEIY